MNTLLFAIALATISIVPANVPRCFVPGVPAEELAKATAVFSGKVVGRDYVVEETSSGEVSQHLVIKIAVARVWKGDIYTETTMYTSEIHLPNGYTRIFAEDFKFDDDKEYLVYAFGKRNRLSTDACTRTRELSKADDDLKELGDGHEPKIRNQIFFEKRRRCSGARVSAHFIDIGLGFLVVSAPAELIRWMASISRQHYCFVGV